MLQKVLSMIGASEEECHSPTSSSQSDTATEYDTQSCLEDSRHACAPATSSDGSLYQPEATGHTAAAKV